MTSSYPGNGERMVIAITPGNTHLPPNKQTQPVQTQNVTTIHLLKHNSLRG